MLSDQGDRNDLEAKAAVKKRKTEALQAAMASYQAKLRKDSKGLPRSQLLDRLVPVAVKFKGKANAKATVKAKAGAG